MNVAATELAMAGVTHLNKALDHYTFLGLHFKSTGKTSMFFYISYGCLTRFSLRSIKNDLLIISSKPSAKIFLQIWSYMRWDLVMFPLASFIAMIGD